jgi:general stress protein 26
MGQNAGNDAHDANDANDANDASEDKKHLHELLESFDTAMLITRHHDGMHARPMAVAGVEGAQCVWFVTSIDSPKAEEISADPRVSATFQAARKFVALSGNATIVRDREKISALWKDVWKVWFPEGKDDPSVALIRVSVDDAELWDNAGGKGIRYVFEAVKGVLAGERPAPVDGQHARIKAGESIPDRGASSGR